MKNITKYIYAGLTLMTLGLFSCNQQLDGPYPRASLIPSVALSDSSGHIGLLMSSYRRLHEFGYYGQTMLLAPEALADNAVIFRNTNRYISEFANTAGAHVDIWDDVYRITNDCNYLLEELNDQSSAIQLGSQWLRNRLTAEALFVRSLVYHDLCKIYGYEPGKEKGGWNKTVVFRLKATKNFTDIGTPTRATNTEIYTQIEADLIKAVSLFDAISATSTYKIIPQNFRANASSARALLARVQLYMGKNAEAAATADATIAGAPASATLGGAVLATPAQYATSATVNLFANTTNATLESLFELSIQTTDWSTVDGANNGMCSLTTDLVTNGQFIIGASQSLVDELNAEAGDVRQRLIVDKGISPTGFKQWMVSKWRGDKSIAVGGLENIPVIRMSEMYLISAEGKARSGNLAGAITTLNTFRAARGLGTINAASTSAQVLDAILKENRKEFFFEGHRFFDLKRYQLGITKVNNPDGSANPGLNADDYRFLARVPTNEIQLNPNLVQNPGY